MEFLIYKLKLFFSKIIKERSIFKFNKKNNCNISLDCNITGGTSNLKVGKGTVINAQCNIRNRTEKVIIGENCLIARNVSFITSQYDLNENKIGNKHLLDKVVIGDNVWIGTNVIIMPGVTVGDGSVIGAQSVVTKNINPMTINCGVPCREIKKRLLK